MKKRQNKKSQNNNLKRKITLISTAIIAISFIIILVLLKNPDRILSKLSTYSISMLTILPAVIILMGLFSVWISKDQVIKWLGKSSGTKGIFVALFFGSLPTGPLFAAFPIAATLRKKGASIKNIVIFLSAWGCVKLPQEIVEFQFMGFNFMLTRLILTVIFIIIMGSIMQILLQKDFV